MTQSRKLSPWQHTSDAGEPKLLRAVFGHLSKVLNESNTASLMEEAAGIMKLREVLRAAAVPGERLLSTIESVLLLLRSMGQFRSPQAGGGAHGPRAAPSAPDQEAGSGTSCALCLWEVSRTKACGKCAEPGSIACRLRTLSSLEAAEQATVRDAILGIRRLPSEGGKASWKGGEAGRIGWRQGGSTRCAAESSG